MWSNDPSSATAELSGWITQRFGNLLCHVAQGGGFAVLRFHLIRERGELKPVLVQRGLAAIRAIWRVEIFKPCLGNRQRRVLPVLQADKLGAAPFQFRSDDRFESCSYHQFSILDSRFQIVEFRIHRRQM